ncbi:MAG: HAMP domain-containing protein [Candidatus Omnitrophica bacterium]|nr:HAMP domain-containing protein [Candidatus Omnitrophota bacterium]
MKTLFKSIRFKITILYVAILALTLTLFSTILYHNVSAGLYNNMDTLLKSKAGGVAQAINTYWQTANLEVTEAGLKPEALIKRRNTNFAKVAQRWVKEESNDPRLLDILVQIFDTDGNIIASSKNAQGLTEISRKNFITVLQGKSRFDTVSSQVQSNRMTMRIYTTPVIENEKVAYIVQVASPLDSIQIALNNLRIVLFILLPITLFATGIMGVLLAKVTLHPVDSMIKTIHQITAENMALKLKVPDTKDEIQHLAETFNEMLDRLGRAFKSQKQLFEDISHELKTPLTILKGEFEVALTKVRSADEYEAMLKSALEEINRIAKLAESLLLLARLDSKEMTPQKMDVDLNLMIKGIINNIKGLAELKGVRISFEIPTGELSLHGDENQLKTLFLNILDNAIKYTPHNGLIEVSTKRATSVANVSIKDTGIGIPGEDIGRIFDRFYRLDTSRDSIGFGLGLSIAKSIAEAHGGTIRASSEAAKGTTFIVSLPLY